ncbi:MAG: hypothetical protein IT406_03365 [Candidatus Yanofskybacteria bacterium]|nr:hypothetical protein [Candidatus Yanofskybacteria bacterium]
MSQSVSAMCIAPAGQWRVVETDGFHGPVRKVVGDFDDSLMARGAMERCERPFARVIYNDRGVQVMSFTP